MAATTPPPPLDWFEWLALREVEKDWRAPKSSHSPLNAGKRPYLSVASLSHTPSPTALLCAVSEPAFCKYGKCTAHGFGPASLRCRRHFTERVCCRPQS